MHAVVTKVTIHDDEAATTFLTEQLVPGVSAAPGFVGGYWVRVGNAGTSITAWESEEAARAAIDNGQLPPENLVTIDSMEVGEVAASA